jgi:hypothetical protein
MSTLLIDICVLFVSILFFSVIDIQLNRLYEDSKVNAPTSQFGISMKFYENLSAVMFVFICSQTVEV